MRRILVVDDDVTQLRIRAAVLSGAGLEVVTAANASSALSIVRSQDSDNPIAIVVTDHVMPGTSGVEFVQQLRRINQSLPIIVLSGLAGAESEYEGQNVTFRLKPCEPSEIISLVRRSFDHAA